VVPASITGTVEYFRMLTEPSARFETYRRKFAQNPPEIVVPYSGTMLTSLVYIFDGNPSTKSIPNIVLHFCKYRTEPQTMEDVFSP
jgi:hypothetical protein